MSTSSDQIDDDIDAIAEHTDPRKLLRLLEDFCYDREKRKVIQRACNFNIDKHRRRERKAESRRTSGRQSDTASLPPRDHCPLHDQPRVRPERFPAMKQEACTGIQRPIASNRYGGVDAQNRPFVHIVTIKPEPEAELSPLHADPLPATAVKTEFLEGTYTEDEASDEFPSDSEEEFKSEGAYDSDVTGNYPSDSEEEEVVEAGFGRCQSLSGTFEDYMSRKARR